MSNDAYVFDQTFSDGSVDHTNPHRPGFRFLDIDDVAKLAADEAYEQMRTRLTDAWRRKREKQSSDHRDGARPRTPTVDALQKDAALAYAERSKRMQNAWKHRDASQA